MLKNKELSLKDLTGQRLCQLHLSLKRPEPIRVRAAAWLVGPSPQEGPGRLPGAGCTHVCRSAVWVLEAGRAPAPLQDACAQGSGRTGGRSPVPWLGQET